MHSPVPSSVLIDALIHIRDLNRRIRPSNEAAMRAFERLEAATKDLLSNIPRTGEHPTVRTLVEVAQIYGLTLDGAHRLFGYDLESFRQYDLTLNGRRTHIFESYPFERDLLIDLPARFAPREAFAADALLRDLVLEWQTDIPIRTLEEEGWEQPGAFYVHVGTEDSPGSSVPPGAIARVEPIDDAESALPNPRRMYLLQFANGYRCSHCVVTRGKLRLFSTARTYLGREEFAYPGAVRIAGRVRMFAMSLPMPEYAVPAASSSKTGGAELILPWEHSTRDRLLLTKHRRFKRSKKEELFVHDFLQDLLHARLSARSERRYRSRSSSEPHVNSLIHLALANAARYTDVLRTGGSWQSDKGRLSLESLLQAKSLTEALSVPSSLHNPTPTDVWEARRNEYGGWPPLLSAAFPRLRQWESSIVRLAQGSRITDLNPALRAGSLLLLEENSSIPDTRSERTKFGWSRPMYVFRKELDITCGFLERNGNHFALLSGADGAINTSFHAEALSQLRRVAGVAVPV